MFAHSSLFARSHLVDEAPRGVSCRPRRLYSLRLWLFARLLEPMLVVAVVVVLFPFIASDPSPSVCGVVVFAVFGLFAGTSIGLRLLVRRVVATPAGLEFRNHPLLHLYSRRTVSWNQVWNIRELRCQVFRSPRRPRAWRVELTSGESFVFVGVYDARAIVRAFWAAYRY